jgi:hypothetical protein
MNARALCINVWWGGNPHGASVDEVTEDLVDKVDNYF